MHSRKNILTIASAAIIIIGGFYYFFYLTAGDETILTSGAPASDVEVSFIALVGQLGSVDFDTHILDDARFNALVDIRTPIVQESAGRKDPFAPLGR